MNPTGTRHAHLDHLGTVRLWTGPGGASPSHHTYTAFGEEVPDNLDGQDHRFTGHERDVSRSAACAGTTTVDDQTLSTPQTIEGCPEQTSENTTVSSTGSVRFRASEKIRLGSGFRVTQGASFAAEIDESLASDLQDLDYMHARYASPVMGRFLSVDPVGGNPRAPQSWNRYAYVVNNPLKYVDPSGLACASVAGFEDIQIDGCITVTDEEPSSLEVKLAEFLAQVNQFKEQARRQIPSLGDSLRGMLQRAPLTNSIPSDFMFIDGEFRQAGPSTEELVAGAVVVAAAAVGRGGSDGRESTPKSDESQFEPVRGSPAKKNTTTGEIWVKDRLHGNHWEVYKNKRDFEKGRRTRAVWDSGALKQKF